MQVTVLERIALLNLLPREGNILTVRTIRDLKKKLEFTESDIKTLDLKPEGQMIRWSHEKEFELTVEFTDGESGIIKAELKRLDEEKKLTADHISLYEKFME